MTRNNLDDHLAWLLRNIDLSTPVGPPLPVADSPNQSFILDLSQNATADRPVRTDAILPPGSSTRSSAEANDPIVVDDDSFTEEQPDRDSAASVGREEGMARLTAVPRKPSLVSKQQQLLTPASTTGGRVGRLQQAYTASLNHDGSNASFTASRSSRNTTPVSISRPRRTRPPALTPDLPELNEELEDLTAPDADTSASTIEEFGDPILLWREDFASRAEPLSDPPSSAPSKRGHKRKSSDITKSTPKFRKEEEDDDEFPDVYDLVDENLRTPAPVKRRTAGSSPKKNPPKLRMTASDTAILEQRTITQTVSRTETLIRRTDSLELRPSQSDTPGASRTKTPKKSGFIAPPPKSTSRRPQSPSKAPPRRRTPSPIPGRKRAISKDSPEQRRPSPTAKMAKKSRRGDVIMDSDDDDFDSPPSRDVSFATCESGTGSKVQLRSSGRGMTVDEGFTVDTPSKGRQDSRNQKTSTTGKNSQVKREYEDMDIDDLREEQKQSAIEAHDDALHSSNTDGATLIMDLFLANPQVLQKPMQDVQAKLAKNSSDFQRSLREKWPQERRNQVKKEKEPLTKQQKLLCDVDAAHKAYQELDKQREEILAQIATAYDEGEDTEKDETRLDELGQTIQEQENTLKTALSAAGIDKPEMFEDLPDAPASPPPDNSAPVVRATQATPRRPPPSLPRESSLIPECSSQVILQTQMPSREQTRTTSFERRAEVIRPPVPPFPREPQPTSRDYQSNSYVKAPPNNFHDDQQMEDLFDDDEEDVFAEFNDPPPRQFTAPTSKTSTSARTRSPAKPKSRAQEEFSDYGDDDLDAMVAVADNFEQRKSSGEPRVHSRSVLSETSGNVGTSSRVKNTSMRDAKLKAKIPEELMRHPWSPAVRKALKDRFRMEGFRENQLEAINATLEGKDAFVLMPTGGGKSLCYQLPAVVNTGRSRGVTIVISPLLSLMQDQIDHLEAQNIVAKSFKGDTDRSDKNDILQAFRGKFPDHFVQLLYVTPEMVNKSSAFLDGLENLYRNNKLARLVIDEAHCVSQWGHDFRPDYKALGEVRRRFPRTPVMALTATATPNVIVDIKHNLSIDGCQVFTQSFNRPNLYYEVRPKEKNPVDHIAGLINDQFPDQTGIVYTMSRKQTEQIAAKLRTHGVDAHHYHAAMDTEEKTKIQRQWQCGETKVVVATIAFGMGIDKADVRFVVHHYLPKSLEGYYQETGRAGRDGKPSYCYLYFGYGDIAQLRKFIYDGDGSHQQKERQKEMLNRVVMFCENKRDCRRSEILHYFGEGFPKEKCHKTCDNCKNGGKFEVQDRTKYAKAVLAALEYHRRLTMVQCTDALMSKKAPEDPEAMRSFHGVAKSLNKTDVNSIIIRLAAEGALDEENKVGGGGVAIQYFVLGHNARAFMTGGRKLEIVTRTGGDKTAPAKTTKKATKKKAATVQPEEPRMPARPTSTAVSSPVRGGARKDKKKGKDVARYFDDEAIAEEDDSDDVEPSGPLHNNGYEQDGFVIGDEEEDEYFEPVRSVPPRRQRTLDELGPPISKSAEVADELLLDIAGAFAEEAKELEEQLRNSRDMRRYIFTEAQMRQMCIRWTTTLDKMKRISDINVDYVNKFGPKFIPLIQRYRHQYRQISGMDSQDTIPATAGPSRGQGGGAAEVVDLLSSDEDADDDDDEEDDDEEGGESSKYFGTAGDDDPIARQQKEWNSRFTQTSQLDDTMSRGGGSGRSGSRGRCGKKPYARRSGGAARGSKSAYSGVSKRKPSAGSRRTSGASSKSGSRSSSSRGGRGGGAAGGGRIGLMPF